MPLSMTVRRYSMALLAYSFAAIMVGTTLPTPMYALFAADLHFHVLTTTIIFAAYAGGVLFALLAFGRWSDVVGRRPVLLAGIGFAVASAIVFVLADSVTELLIGPRVVRVVGGPVHRHRHRRGHRGGTAGAGVPGPPRSRPSSTSVGSVSARCWPVCWCSTPPARSI